MPPLPRPQPRIPGDLSRGNRVGVIGDSLAGDKSTQTTNGRLAANSRWFFWACALSGGRAWHAANMGVNGETSTEILARFDADVINQSPRWDKVAINAGTNDDKSGTMETTRTNIAAMVRRAKAAGIEPILTTLTPNDGRTSDQKTAVQYLNNWVTYYGGMNGIPVLDLWSPAVDVANSDYWRSGYSDDTLHPNQTGALALGSAVATRFAALFPPVTFPFHTLSAQGANLIQNGCFVGDTNADGVANTWSIGGNGSGTAATSLEAADKSEAHGNWQVLEMSGTAGSRDITGATISTGFSVGDRMVYAGKIKTSGFVAGGSYVLASVVCTGASPGTLYALYNVSLDLTLIEFAVEFTVPASTTALAPRISSYAVSGSGGQGTLKAAQLTLLNLTTMGFA